MASTLFLTTGCFGKFALVKTVYEFNDSIAGDDMAGKFVKTLVMWGLWIIPVYELSSFADLIIFNLIEFWTGSNPLAMVDGQKETQIVVRDGVKYQITATRNTFEITPLSGSKKGEKQSIAFNTSDIAWYNTTNGAHQKLVQYQLDENGNIASARYFGKDQSVVFTGKQLDAFANSVAAR